MRAAEEGSWVASRELAAVDAASALAAVAVPNLEPANGARPLHAPFRRFEGHDFFNWGKHALKF